MDAEQYRRRARHYLIRARQMLNPVNRVTMIDMAMIWMRMAEGKPKVPSWAATSRCLEPDINRSKMIPPGGWGGAVPIYRLLQDESFEPEHVALMGSVFEDVLHTLGLIDREDPITRLVAMTVIELAQAGERDPERLKRLTLEALEHRERKHVGADDRVGRIGVDEALQPAHGQPVDACSQRARRRRRIRVGDIA